MTFWLTTFQFMLALVLVVNFLYFTLAHERKQSVLGFTPRCTAKEGINHPINITMDTNINYVIDVGKLFYQVFIVGLFMNFIIAIECLFVCFTSRKHAKWIYTGAIVTKTVDVLFLLMVTSVRWSHAGKVCSGDYLFKPISLETRSSGFLGIEG